MHILCATCADCHVAEGVSTVVVTQSALLDEREGEVAAVLYQASASEGSRDAPVGSDELQPFGAPRSSSIWQSMASSVAAELCVRVEEELKTSQVQNYEVCAGSTALAMLWGQFFQASDNAAFRSVALQVSPEPKGDALHFVVDLKRRAPMQRFGVECTELSGDPGVLVITGVERGGCVENWNDHCSQLSMPWKRLHLCAAITAVNGISGSARRMKQEMGQSAQVILVACNPPSLCDAVMLLRAVRAAAPLHGRPFWVGGQSKATRRGMPVRPIPSPAHQAATLICRPGPAAASPSPPPRPEPASAVPRLGAERDEDGAKTPRDCEVAEEDDDEAAHTPPDPEADEPASARSPPASSPRQRAAI